MSDSTPDRAWAGHVLFPRSSDELRSTTSCPACLTPLTAVVCTRCRLDLRHPAAADLASASVAIADALDARLDIIGRIRRETAAAALDGAAAPAAEAPAAAVPVAAAQLSAAVPAATTVPAPTTPAAPPMQTVTPGPRRSGIQISLIVVGISLLSVFAVFGLVYAFVTFGSTVRMAIIVGGTLATMIAAGVLGRRGLTMTAEGLAALGTVMLVLDAWALRLNDPAGLGSSDEALYWGVALLIVAATAGLWTRTSRLSIPAVVAAGLLPIGAALLTGHLVDQLLPSVAGAASTAAGLAGVVVAALSWWIAPAGQAAARRGAQLVALSIGAIASIVALASIVELDPGARFAPVIGGLLLAAAAALHVVTLTPDVRRGAAAGRPRALDTVVLGALGAGAALAAVTGAVIAAARFDQDRVIVSAPLIAATIVAVAAEQVWRRTTAGAAARAAAASATITATGLTASGGGLAALVAVAAFVEAGTRGLQIVLLGPGDPVTSGEPTTIAAIGALGLALGIVALHWATLGLLAGRARALTLIGGIVIVAAVPLLPAWWLVMLAFTALAVGGAVGLLLLHRLDSTDARRALAAQCIPLASGAALGAFVTGWAVPRGWAWGLLVALVTIGIARRSTPHIALRATFLGLAAALVLGSMPALADDLALAVPGLSLSAGTVVLIAAAVLIASSQLGRLAALERYPVGAVAIIAAALAALAPAGSTIDEAIALALVVAALSIAAVRGGTAERLTARALLPLGVARAAVVALGQDGFFADALSAHLIAVVALSALVVVAIVALVVETGRQRVVGDIAAGLAGAAIVLAATSNATSADLAWLPVLVLAVLVLTTATSRDGLVGSRSRRRFIGWGALALATTALWMRLSDSGETAPEPYVLPLAGAMLLVVAASAVSGRRNAQRGQSRSAAPITAAALLIALLPSATQSGWLALVDVDAPSALARAVVVALAAAALVIGGAVAERRVDVALPAMSRALVASGMIALTVLAATQTLDLLRSGATLDTAGLLRATVLVAVVSAIGVTVRVLAEGRIRDAATAGALGVAALCAGMLGLAGTVDPVELVSVPLAIALIAVGVLQLDAVPSARSWPWLAPGIVVLLAPSLLAIDAVGEPLWRAVAIGVVAASVFVIGLRARLQALFVLGGVALLIHLLVQSWPLLQLVGETVEWWIWLGLAGVLIVVVAARYERRMQNVRDAATRIAELR